jgi:replicative DNA helicase
LIADRYRGNPTAEIIELSNACAALAKQLNIGVLALCQLSRAATSDRVDEGEFFEPIHRDIFR